MILFVAFITMPYPFILLSIFLVSFVIILLSIYSFIRVRRIQSENDKQTDVEFSEEDTHNGFSLSRLIIVALSRLIIVVLIIFAAIMAIKWFGRMIQESIEQCHDPVHEPGQFEHSMKLVFDNAMYITSDALQKFQECITNLIK